MKDIKGTKTERNVMTAFTGESQARNRYTFFASQAKKDGFILVQEIFLETANQESAHAKQLFKFMQGGTCGINPDAAFPAGVISDTYNNLLEAAAGEHEEWAEMYPKFAAIAQDEGFQEIANVMRAIQSAEEFHEKRYRELAAMIKDNTMFHSEQEVTWRCLNCGCLVVGKDAPKACPACFHPTAYFARKDFNF